MDVAGSDASSPNDPPPNGRAGQLFDPCPTTAQDSVLDERVQRCHLQALAGCTPTDGVEANTSVPSIGQVPLTIARARELLAEAKTIQWEQHYIKRGAVVTRDRAIYCWLQHFGATLPAIELVGKSDFKSFRRNLEKHFADPDGDAIKRRMARARSDEQRDGARADLETRKRLQERLLAAPLITNALPMKLQQYISHTSTTAPSTPRPPLQLPRLPPLPQPIHHTPPTRLPPAPLLPQLLPSLTPPPQPTRQQPKLPLLSRPMTTLGQTSRLASAPHRTRSSCTISRLRTRGMRRRRLRTLRHGNPTETIVIASAPSKSRLPS